MNSENSLLKTVNRRVARIALAGALGAGAVILSACQSTPPEPKSETTNKEKIQAGVPGGAVVETHTVTANITKIDKSMRLVTLALPEGRTSTIHCGPEIVNFDQFNVGDQVKAVLTEELAVAMADANEPDSGALAFVELAPKGGKPGGMVAETHVVTATVTAINVPKHQATLTFPDGTSRTLLVRKDVDLTKRSVGEKVSIRTTETLALSVEKS